MLLRRWESFARRLTLEDRVALLVNALASERDHKPVVKARMNGSALGLRACGFTLHPATNGLRSRQKSG